MKDRQRLSFFMPSPIYAPSQSGSLPDQHKSQKIGLNASRRTFCFQVTFPIRTGPKTPPTLLREALHGFLDLVIHDFEYNLSIPHLRHTIGGTTRPQ
jgi:hypothetical protein